MMVRCQVVMPMAKGLDAARTCTRKNVEAHPHTHTAKRSCSPLTYIEKHLLVSSMVKSTSHKSHQDQSTPRSAR
jgi:hypothetical protein